MPLDKSVRCYETKLHVPPFRRTIYECTVRAEKNENRAFFQRKKIAIISSLSLIIGMYSDKISAMTINRDIRYF